MGTALFSRRRRAIRTMAVMLGVSLAAVSAVAAPASAAKPSKRFAAYATGSVLHADALEVGGTRLVNVDEAFSGASVDSAGLAKEIRTELETLVQPKLSAKKTFARGSGLEVGMGLAAGAANQVKLAGLAQAAAAPVSGLVKKELGPVKLNPIAYASLLRGTAEANWETGGACPLGEDVSRGGGFAADLQLLNTGGVGAAGTLLKPILAVDAPKPERQVAASVSRTVLVRQTDSSGKVVGKNFGLMSETRMTIAPVTLFRGTSNMLTIEFLGEWVLQVISTGLEGGSIVHYGPGTVSPQTPVLRLLDAVGKVTNIVTLQQLFGPSGLGLKVPGIGLELAIGEDPRAIGGSASSKPARSSKGTFTAAAVDVVRVKLPGVLNLRVGHMEAQSSVPAGGIVCNLPTVKVADEESVKVGDGFKTVIKVLNPFGCELQHVRVVDAITTKGGARFDITGTMPKASSATAGGALAKGTIVWKDIGTIPAGKSKTVVAAFDTAGGGGQIIDVATATGVLGNCTGRGSEVVGAAKSVTGATITGPSPVVKVGTNKVLPRKTLPITGVGSAGPILGGLAMLAGAFATRRTLRKIV